MANGLSAGECAFSNFSPGDLTARRIASYSRISPQMAWLEREIRRYEHRRWTVDDNRRVLPFDWGLEHIGGSPESDEPRAFLHRFSDQTIAHSDAVFATEPATDYRLEAEADGPG